MSVASSPARERPQIKGHSKGEPQPKDPCLGCGKMVTRGRPGKEHTPGADGRRPCELKTAKRLEEPIVTKPGKTEDYSFADYDDLDAMAKADAGPEVAPIGSPTPGQPLAPGETPGPGQLSFADMSQLADPMTLWGGAADFCNGFITNPDATAKIKMTQQKAEGLSRGLFYILPRALLNPYGAFAIAIFFVFGLPLSREAGYRRKLKADAKREADERAARTKGTSTTAQPAGVAA